MAGNENTIELTFKMNDQGSITIDKINSKLNEIGQNTEKMNSSLSVIKFSSVVQLGEAAFHTAERIYNMARTTASAINDIERMSKIAGMSTDAFQKMSYAAKMNDVDVESMGKGMKILAGHMDDVRKGSETAKGLFESIGISTLDTSGKVKSFDTILGDLADRFKSMPDGVSKVALATDLFGRSGQNLIPMLNQGKAGLQEFYREAERLGIILDESLIKKGSELEDRFKKAEAWWSALFKKIVIGAYEAVDAISKVEVPESWLAYAHPAYQLANRRPSVSMFSVGNVGLEGIDTSVYIRKSEEAIKAETRALEEAAKKEAQLNEFFASDVEILKQATREAERRSQALELLSKLGIKTEAAARQEIEKLMDEFKLLANFGLTTEQMDQVKAKYTAFLADIKNKYAATMTDMEESAGHWEEILMPSGVEISGGALGGMRTTWESQWRWIEDSVKVYSGKARDDLGTNVGRMVDDAIRDLDRMQRQIDLMTRNPNHLSFDISEIGIAMSQLDSLEGRLIQISNTSWKINFDITGTGSEELPILDKIEQISSAFQTMGSEIGNMTLQMNLSQIRAQMAQISASLRMNEDFPTRMVGQSWGGYEYQRQQWELSRKAQGAQLADLQTMYNALLSANYMGGGGGGYGGGGGGPSINIGVINVIGGSDMEIAQKLDAAIAELWVKDRSKLKKVIEA